MVFLPIRFGFLRVPTTVRARRVQISTSDVLFAGTCTDGAGLGWYSNFVPILSIFAFRQWFALCSPYVITTIGRL